MAEKLVDSGLVSEPLDLFALELPALAALNLGTPEEPRVFGEKNAAKAIEALRRARSLPLARWLFAIGIPNVGEQIAYELARLHRDFQDLADSALLREIQAGDKSSPALLEELGKRLEANPGLRAEAEAARQRIGGETARLRAELEDTLSRIEQGAEAGAEDLAALKKRRDSLKGRIKTLEGNLPTAGLSQEIGAVVARSVLDYFGSAHGRKLLKRLKELGIAPAGQAAEAASAGIERPLLAGKTFVLTGTLGAMTRDDAAAEIRKRGGAVVNSVSRNTSYLVVGESAGATKSRQARELGVAELSEQQFLRLLGLKGQPSKPGQQDLFGG